MPPKPKVSKPNADIAPLLKSPAYDKLLKWLETGHPVKLSLPAGTTLEQRALHQVKSQCFEEILLSLRTLQFEANRATIPVTYEKQKDK